MIEDKQTTDQELINAITGHYWQLCPKCCGSGKGMNYSHQIPTTLDQCDVCNGKKIISTITGLPPN